MSRFLRIGVVFRKPVSPIASLHRTKYWTMAMEIKRIHRANFIQELKSDKYQYKYTKTVQLTKGKPEILLRHTLETRVVTSSRRMCTIQFLCH